VNAPYLRDADAIYAQSFATIRAETDLSRFPAALQPVVVRMIHACGMTEIAEDIGWGGEVVAAASAALRRGAPVLCDCEAVRAGISRRYLPAETELLVTLAEPEVANLAQSLKTTRSAAAVTLWRDRLDGAMVVIGNAPTALFQLLDMLATGAPQPAAIIAAPVGFVGATESKAALVAQSHDVPFVTLLGRRGGSAIAAAALNAIAIEAAA